MLLRRAKLAWLHCSRVWCSLCIRPIAICFGGGLGLVEAEALAWAFGLKIVAQ